MTNGIEGVDIAIEKDRENTGVEITERSTEVVSKIREGLGVALNDANDPDLLWLPARAED